jgi:hypothetical protein
VALLSAARLNTDSLFFLHFCEPRPRITRRIANRIPTPWNAQRGGISSLYSYTPVLRSRSRVAPAAGEARSVPASGQPEVRPGPIARRF